MVMTWEKFEALVRRLELVEMRDPGGYKLRVFLLAVLGYAYIFSILAVLLLILGFEAAFLYFLLSSTEFPAWILILGNKVVLPFFLFALLIIRSLWFRFEPPVGVELKREEAPVLFKELDRVRGELKGPAVHRVLVDGNFNAGVVQMPRLGPLGWQKNYLIVGLPYMMAMSPEEMLAVFAHEYGHLSGAHGKFGAWVHRNRRTWYNLMESLARRGHWGMFVFTWFSNWYAPYFNAYTFVMARKHELDADRCATEMVGAGPGATGLMRGAVMGRFFEEKFWPALYKKANDHPEPTFNPFASMPRALKGHISDKEAGRYLKAALTEKTGGQDTHPSLSERLSAMGRKAEMPPPVEVSAAEHYLAGALKHVTGRLDREWKDSVRASWKERHAQALEAKATLKELESRAQGGKGGKLTRGELWDYARHTEEFKGSAEAVELYRELLSKEEAHAGANYALGRILLLGGDEAGRAHIDKAIKADSEYVMEGTRLVYDFLMGEGRAKEAREYWDMARDRAEMEEWAMSERASLGDGDSLLPHAVAEKEVEAIAGQLRAYKDIKEAYLVRKSVRLLPEKPLYILGVVRSWPRFSLYSDDDYGRKLAEGLKLPGDGFVIVLDGKMKDLGKRMKHVYGSKIYHKKRGESGGVLPPPPSTS
ncbi:MAG: M48 family metallopeptidase [Thermodesulfobacteriota bacterium]